MSETYPVILNGQECGTLTVRRQGLTTEFAARCAETGRLLRLSVYGAGAEGYLWVMEPMGGELYLCRRFSRAAMAGFPAVIEYAGESGAANIPAAPPPVEKENAPPRNRDRTGRRERDRFWYSAPDGSLYTFWEGKTYRAIPMAAWGLPLERAVERRVIDAVEYAVFEVKDGQIV